MKNDIDALTERLTVDEQNMKRKDNLIAEMKKDLEIFRREYAQLEYNYTTLLNEHSLLTKKANSAQEINNQLDNEVNSLRERLRKIEDDFRQSQTDVNILQKEKGDLLGKTEYISTQVKKVFN
jgi:archaellum component FlaC